MRGSTPAATPRWWARWRVRVWTAGAAVVAAGVVTVVATQSWQAEGEARSQVVARFADRVAATADFVNAYGPDLVAVVGRSVDVHLNRPDPSRADLGVVVAATDLVGAHLVDRDGRVVVTSAEDFAPEGAEAVDPFREGATVTASDAGQLWVTLPLPATGDQLAFRGLLDLVDTPLFGFVETMLPLEGQQTVLVDQDGSIVLSSDPGLTGPVDAALPGWEAAAGTDVGSLTLHGESNQIAARPVGDTGWTIVGWMSDDELFAPLQSSGWPLWVLPAVLALLAIVGVGRLHAVLVDREEATVAARFDQLTGLANRKELERHVERHRRRGGALGVLMVDVDRFKAVNDEFGHQRGDEVLHEVADTIIRNVRPGDVPARWGGEEFVVLLPDATAEGAFEVAERLRGAVEAEVAVGGRTVTVSVGCAAVAASPPAAGRGPTMGELVGRADRAMYRAKIGGRNRVEVDPALV